MEVTVDQDSVLLPDIIIGGVAKSGTTTVAHWLSQHSEVFCPRKEPGFLAYARQSQQEIPEHIRARQITEVAELNELYKGHEQRRILDASVACFTKSTQCIDNLKHFYQNAETKPRIILILRQPVERAFSNYMMLVKNGYESLSFEEALASDVVEERNHLRAGFDYLGNSAYAQRLREFMESGFPVKVWLFEDLKKPEKMYREVLEFCHLSFEEVNMDAQLNISGKPQSGTFYNLLRGNRRINALVKRVLPESAAHKLKQLKSKVLASQLKPVSLDKELKRRLTEECKADIKETGQLIGRDLSHWYA